MAENKILKLTVAAKTAKAFKAQDGTWYNVNDVVIPDLEKTSKGDTIDIEYYEKGIAKYVTKITKAKDNVIKEPTKEEVKKEAEPTGFNCSECGKVLKDGKFKRCYDCNIKKKETAPEKETETATTGTTGFKCIDCGKALKDNKYEKCFDCNKKNPSKKNWGKKSNYDSPERIAAIQKGNSLNAAAAVISGNLVGQDIDTLKETTLALANCFLDWLRNE